MKILSLNLCVVLSVTLFISSGFCSEQKISSEQSRLDTNAKLYDMGNGTCESSTSGLVWQIKRSRQFDSWQKAVEYAEGLELGGFTDWRLPTKEELKNLHEIFDWDENGNCKMISFSSYWSGDSLKQSFCGFIETIPQCGSTGYEFAEAQGGKGSVRAVRP